MIGEAISHYRILSKLGAAPVRGTITKDVVLIKDFG